jgi:hypothetical protein
MDKKLELDRYLRPHAVTAGTAVTREIVEIIKEWAEGKIGWNKKGDRTTLKLAKQALASNARWFAITLKKDSTECVTKLTPVTSIAAAKRLGFKPYRVPGFPKGYNPGELVGEQHFTYGQLYAAWRGAFEDMITADKDNYPFFADLRAHPDYDAWESLECSTDDLEEIFSYFTRLSREIDAMCVDVYFNDNWNNQADPDYFTFHIENGVIDSEIRREFLPEGSEARIAKRNALVASEETIAQVKKFFTDNRRKAPAVFISEGKDTGTTLMFRPKGLGLYRLSLNEAGKWLCEELDPKDRSTVIGTGTYCESPYRAVNCCGLDPSALKDVPLDVPGFTRENIRKARELARELTAHLKSSGLKLGFDLDDDRLFIVPKGTIWGTQETPRGYRDADGNLISEMASKSMLTKEGDIVSVHLCDSSENFDGELHYPAK